MIINAQISRQLKIYFFIFISTFIFETKINAAGITCWTYTSWSSCSNCRHSRKKCACNGGSCTTQSGNCCTSQCGGCGSCPYGSSGTYTCGNCSCAIQCPRCCSAPTCNSGETTTSSPYGSSCNATTVSRSNGCGYSITCYTHKSATAGTCATGYVTSSASCPLGVESTYNVPGFCGGSTTTCYKCQTCVQPVAGVCNPGDFTTLAAVLGDGSCQYPYTTYITTNASCGGSNITCYKRGASPFFTSGSCQPGERTTSCPATETLISSYVTTNAQCGGSNITCYKCSNAFCSLANTYADGSADCRYCLNKDDIQCQDFPPSVPDLDPKNVCTTPPNQLATDKCVVLTQADGSKSLSCYSLSAANPYIFLRGNDGSDGSQNYRPITCSEYSSDYVAASECEKNQLPIPIENFCDGDSYFNGVASQCVTCLNAAAPWFQVINANIYARGSIESDVNLSEVPVMRNSDPICSTDSASLSGVGVPVAGNKVLNITSQNNNGVIANFANGFANIDPEDYGFFARYFGYSTQELTDPENVKRCPSDLNSNDSNFYNFKDAFICLIKSENNFQTKLSDFLPNANETENSESPLLIPAGVRKVIFVSGDILLDREIILAPKNENQEQGFFMLIASGNIEVSSYLGDFLTEANFSTIGGSCAYQSPALHGLFIANGTINFSSGGTNNAFTNSSVNRNCDKKITVKGSFIGWGKNSSNQPGILMSRTFLGCVPGSFADSEVPTYTNYNLNYNSKTPVITFIYDADLLNQLPNWVNKTIWQRFEVN